MSSADSGADIILNSSADWNGWNREFTNKMRALHLLGYFKGEMELLEEPPRQFNSIKSFLDLREKHINAAMQGKRFDYANLDNELEDATILSDYVKTEDIDSYLTTTTATTTGPTSGDIEIKKAVKEIEDFFKTHDSIIIGDLVRNYELRIKEWEAQDTCLLEAHTFLTTTVSPILRNAYFSVDGDMRTWYNNLKSVAPQPFENERAIRMGLRIHVETLQAPKYQAINRPDFERWLTKWETLMNEATLHGLAEITIVGLWFEDFIRAITNLFPVFAAMLRIHAGKQGNQLSFREVATDVRQAIPYLFDARNGRIIKGTFLESSPDGNDNNDQEEDKGFTAPARKISRPPKRKASSADEKLQCRACRGIHKTERCFYLKPELAPGNWEPRDHVRERVEESLRMDPTLRIETARPRPKKSKSNLKRRLGNNIKQEDTTEH
ncbi:hypothetical protein VTI28DRAFT_9727 [Corynascus sepedonium]